MTTEFTDIHILINTIHAPSILNSSASASWLPICLPKFNPSAFVNAYVTFIRPGSEADQVVSSPSTSSGTQDDQPEVTTIAKVDADNASISQPSASVKFPTPPVAPVEIGLVCISGQADFEAVRSWCSTVTEVCSHLLVEFAVG